MTRSMAMTFERRVSPVAEWARRVSGFTIVLLFVAGIAHRYGLLETVAFLWTLALVAVLAVCAIGLAAGGFSSLWRRGDKAGQASLTAVLLAVVVLAPFGVGGWLYWRLPALTDISTDLDQPPDFIVAPRLRDGQMNVVAPISAAAAAQQMQAYPDVAGRRLDASPDRIFAALAPVIAARNWTLHGTIPTSVPAPEMTGSETQASEISVEMEAPGFLLRFPADAVVRLSNNEESTYVDMRVATRYGWHDLGMNVRVIRAFMAELEAELERQSLQIIDIPPSDGDVDRVE